MLGGVVTDTAVAICVTKAWTRVTQVAKPSLLSASSNCFSKLDIAAEEDSCSATASKPHRVVVTALQSRVLAQMNEKQRSSELPSS